MPLFMPMPMLITSKRFCKHCALLNSIITQLIIMPLFMPMQMLITSKRFYMHCALLNSIITQLIIMPLFMQMPMLITSKRFCKHCAKPQNNTTKTTPQSAYWCRYAVGIPPVKSFKRIIPPLFLLFLEFRFLGKSHLSYF